MKIETLNISLLKPSPESLVLHVHEFHYDPEADHTFANWFERCENTFRNDLANIPDDVKARLLLQMLELAENERFRCVIHPGRILDLNFDKTVSILSYLFDIKYSKVQKCFKCLSLTKECNED